MGTVSRHNVHTIRMQRKTNYITFVLAKMTLGILLPLKNYTTWSKGIDNTPTGVANYIGISILSVISKYVFKHGSG
jgi:hypothetical protein